MEKVIEVVWTKRSSFDLRKIFDFNSELKDAEKAAEIVDSIIDTVERSLIDKLDVGANVKIEDDENQVNDYLMNNFKFCNVRRFHEPFSGLICQSNEKWKEYPYENFPERVFKNQEEVEYYFEKGIRDRTSRDYEKVLPNRVFFRSYKSHLININHIRKYIKSDGGKIEMDDGYYADLSRSKKEKFSQLINKV